MDLKRYEFEIRHIITELENLEEGVFYEEGCVKHPGTASAKTIAKNLKRNFIELIDKIKNDKLGTCEMIDKAFKDS